VQGSEAEKFIEKNCVQVATDESGWEILYLAKSTQEFWLKTYPNSEHHGGGDPLLTKITKESAQVKFSV
jgi:hypothetical protein